MNSRDLTTMLLMGLAVAFSISLALTDDRNVRICQITSCIALALYAGQTLYFGWRDRRATNLVDESMGDGQ